MKTITIHQLIDLVEGEAPSAHNCIQKIFEWRYERDMSIAKWALGVSASLAIAISVAYIRSEQEISLTEYVSALFFAAVSASYGVYILTRLRHLAQHFTAAVALYSKLRRIDEFIRRYRIVV